MSGIKEGASQAGKCFLCQRASITKDLDRRSVRATLAAFHAAGYEVVRRNA